MTPVVSVLLPVYNADPFLADAIESILGQTLKELELLVCDDGSTDGSVGIAERFARLDSRVRLLTPGRLGFAGILNAGLSEARGSILARMDADDISLPDRLARQVEFLDRNPGIGAVGGHAITIDRNGVQTGEWKVELKPEKIDQDHITGWKVQMIHPTVAMRTDLLRRLGGYRVETKPVEDIDLWLRMAELSRLANIDAPLIQYRVLNTSYSNSDPKMTGAAFTRIAMEARERRGLPHVALPPPIWIDPAPRDPYDRAVFDGLAAIKDGDFTTARKIGLRLVTQRPWSKRAWSLVIARKPRV